MSKKREKIIIVVVLILCGLMLAATTLLVSIRVYGQINPLYDGGPLLRSPLLLLLNALPCILLIIALFFFTDKVWLAYTLSGFLLLGLTFINYYKCVFRGNPLYISDIYSAKDAADIMVRYTFRLNGTVITGIVVYTFIGVTLILFRSQFEKKIFSRKTRLIVSLLTLLSFVGWGAIASSDELYRATSIQQQGFQLERQSYMAHGFLYPLCYTALTRSSAHTMVRETGNSEKNGRIYQLFSDEDIPEEQKVQVLCIMLEAFSDLTEKGSPVLNSSEAVQELYAPWHDLENRAYSGNKVSNDFAGGTALEERSCLTGISTPFDVEAEKIRNSYVYYFNSQGYSTSFYHPYIGSFYERELANPLLGFTYSKFLENGYEAIVGPEEKWFDSDGIVFSDVLRHLDEKKGEHEFSFIVTLQNHGPYRSDKTVWREFLTKEAGISSESRNIVNNYLEILGRTINSTVELIAELENRDYPIVVLIFGDHMPWLGDGNTAYFELGIDLSAETEDSFYNFYTTPYLIWANPKAKETLGAEFTGVGPDLSTCFLLTELFDLCGWKGPQFMQYSRTLKNISTIFHWEGVYRFEDHLTCLLPKEEQQYCNTRFGAERYYMKGN